MAKKFYECQNAGCALGTMGQAGGRFTAGITADALHILTGRPVDDMKKGEDYGDGICPNCGKKGKEI